MRCTLRLMRFADAAGANTAKNMTTDKNTARIDELTEAGHGIPSPDSSNVVG